MAKADVAIFKAKNGSFLVRPGTYIVESRPSNTANNPPDAVVWFKNVTALSAVIVFPDNAAPLTKVLGANQKDSVNLAQLGSGVHEYHVLIGGTFAEGNSDPSIIVD